MTLLEQIGLMVMVGFRGYEIIPGSTIAKDIADRNVGGTILFDRDMTENLPRNVQNPAQVKKLVAQARALSKSNLIVSIDHEGGFVCRLKEKYGFPKTLTALKMAALPEMEFAAAARAMVGTLADAGINFNFAPVVDVNVNPLSPAIGKYERSFSGDPDVVADKAGGLIAAHRERRVLTSLKHFPGHGSAAVDSHFGMTDITETWSELELRPFETLIKAGLVDTVTTAHVFHKRLDPKYPVTLSPTVLSQLLRKRMGFDGVIMSDDMQMGAITQHYGLETAVKLAIQAGVDMLVFGNNVSFDEHIGEKVIATIAKLVAQGDIPEARIHESVRRIQELKAKL